MKKINKVGLLVTIMILGVTNLSQNTAFCEPATEGVILTAPETESVIKANKETLENAKSEMSNKNYQAAIKYLDIYIDKKPKKYEGYKLRGECYYALRKYDLAQKDFQTAVDIKTSDDKFITGTKIVGAVVLGADKSEQYQNTELGNLYGKLYYAQKALNNSEYETSFKNAFRYNSHIYLPKPNANDILKINCPQKYGKILNPQGIDADIMNIINDVESGDYHEAAYKLPNITTAYPEYYLGHYLTGVVMVGLEQENDAIKSFERALELNPDDFESLASLGQIYYTEAEKKLSKSDAQKSINYFEKALNLNPHLSTYNYYIGLNNLILGNNQNAIESFNNAISKRANDYNSQYYRAIAQYLVGDYQSVEDSTTKLLNKHVSNYNSVLYLRALAKSKSNNEDGALEDIEKAFSSMEDIYNADVKTLSAKEQTLKSYLHYLKAKILENKGEDSNNEYELAFQNPIIKTLNSDTDYDFTIKFYDLENQMDYIKTTFENIGQIYFDGEDYRLSKKVIIEKPLTDNSENEALERDTSIFEPTVEQKFVQMNLQNQTQDEIEEKQKTPQITLKQSSDPEELIIQNPEETSLAQILASKSNIKPDKIDETETISEITNTKTNTENIEKSVIEKENVISNKNDNTVISAPVQKETEDFNIRYENERVAQVKENISENITKVSEEIKETAEKISEPLLTVAKEIKETPEFKITYNDEPQKDKILEENLDTEKVAEKVAPKVQSVENTIAEQEPIIRDKQETISQTPAVILPDLNETVDNVVKNKSNTIVEKYAQVDLNEYDIPNFIPEIKETDEIIVFEPEQFTLGEKIALEDITLKTKPNITDDFSKIHKNNEIKEPEINVEEVKAESVEINTPEIVANNKEPELILPENVEIEKEKVEEAKTIVETTPIVVPQIRTTKKEIENVIEETVAAQKEPQNQFGAEVEQPVKEEDQKWLADFLSKTEAITQEPVQKAKKTKNKKTNELNELNEFLTDDSKTVKTKKFKNIFAKKEKEVQDGIETTEKITKEKKKLFKRVKKEQEDIDRGAITVIPSSNKSQKDEAKKIEKELKANQKLAKKEAKKIQKEKEKEIKLAQKQATKELKQANKTIEKKENKFITWFKNRKTAKVKTEKPKRKWWWKKKENLDINTEN